MLQLDNTKQGLAANVLIILSGGFPEPANEKHLNFILKEIE